MKPIKTEYYGMIEQYIDTYRERFGTAPSIKEIAAELNVSVSTAWRYLKRMGAEGLIEYHGGYGRIRTIQDEKDKEQRSRIPIAGSVSCGLPLFAEENIEEYLTLPKTWTGDGDIFALQANGQSMKNAGIDLGDYVLVRKQAYADPGQIVVALIDNENATLKRFFPHPNTNEIELRPENESYQPQFFNLDEHTVSIQGVSVGVYHFFERVAEA